MVLGESEPEISRQVRLIGSGWSDAPALVSEGEGANERHIDQARHESSLFVIEGEDVANVVFERRRYRETRTSRQKLDAALKEIQRTADVIVEGVPATVDQVPHGMISAYDDKVSPGGPEDFNQP